MEDSNNSRLETFCDGVFAIALTLLVLEIKAPLAEEIHTPADLWLALRHLLPSIVAFLLSFIIILITWVNHHEFMKLIDKSSPHFIYANAVLLLAIVILPFPTALIAEFAFTPAAGPAIVVYSAVNLLAAVGWFLMLQAATGSRPLIRRDASKEALALVRKQTWGAVTIYAACAVLSFWFPRTIGIVLVVLWINWLVLGLMNLGGERPA